MSKSGSDNFGQCFNTGSSFFTRKNNLRVTAYEALNNYYFRVVWFHVMGSEVKNTSTKCFENDKCDNHPTLACSANCTEENSRAKRTMIAVVSCRRLWSSFRSSLGTIVSFLSPESARFMLISVITQCVLQVNSPTVLFPVKLQSSLGLTWLKCNVKTM